MVTRLEYYLVLSLLILTIGCSPSTNKLREPDWIITWGNPVQQFWENWGSVNAHQILPGPDDSLYVVGRFSGNIDFDPGEEDHYIEVECISFYLSKIDRNGDLDWVHTWSLYEEFDPSMDVCPSSQPYFSVDPDGNAYVTYWYLESWDFELNQDGVNAPTQKRETAFVIVIDGQGNVRRTLTWEDTRLSFNWIDASDSESMYMTGSFRGTVDFDPGPERFELQSEEDASATFIGRFDLDGTPIWIKTWDDINQIRSALRTDDGFYLTSRYTDSVDLDPGEGTSRHNSYGTSRACLIKLDQDGEFLWANSLGGDGAVDPVATAVDEYGNIYITGNFTGTSDFDPARGPGSAYTHTTEGFNAFLVKYNSNGDLQWVQSWGDGDPGDEAGGHDLAIQDGRIYVCGTLIGTVDFDPTSSVLRVDSPESQDSFVSAFDYDGKFLWVSTVGSATGSDHFREITVDSSGNITALGEMGKESCLVRFSP